MLNGQISSQSSIETGVLQGSILEPLFFICRKIFKADLQKTPKQNIFERKTKQLFYYANKLQNNFPSAPLKTIYKSYIRPYLD